MEANSVSATYDQAPKYKAIINIVAPLLFMLAACISAIVEISHGERLDTGDLIVLTTILSVGGIWVIGTMIWYRRYFHEITIKTVVQCAKGAKQTSTEDEVRVHIVEIYMENDTHSTEKSALPGKVDETPNESVHLCQEDSARIPMMTCTDGGKSDVKSDDDSV